MAKFELVIPHTLNFEGGYNNIKEDRGGATNWGITLETYKERINHNATEEDIKKLTKDEAIKIYKRFYWDFNNLDAVNSQKIANKLFDVGVNCGTKTAIIYCQRILKIDVDGFCGVKTINAINSCNETLFLTKYVELQKLHYLDIVKGKPDQEKFLKGWLKRAEYLG